MHTKDIQLQATDPFEYEASSSFSMMYPYGTIEYPSLVLQRSKEDSIENLRFV